MIKRCFFSSAVAITPLAINRMSKQGDLILTLYDVNQQRLIDNGGSVVIGDRLFIEVKYRTSLNGNSTWIKSLTFFSFDR